MDNFLFFILNVFINSLLSFFTALLLIELVIFLFRLRQGRTAAFLRMIPILKLPLDLALYDFSRWTHLHGVNPVLCPDGTRTLSVWFGYMGSIKHKFYLPFSSGIQLTTDEKMTFTLADLIGYTINPIFLKAFSFVFLSLTFFFISKKVISYHQYRQALKLLKKVSTPFYKRPSNYLLKKKIKKSSTKILSSSALPRSPFVAGLSSSFIFVDKDLLQNLTGKEYEAVLAHETGHISHRDGLVRMILDLIESFYWWIPSKWLRSRIEEGQEIGCDANCKKYGIDPTDLASAICKSARYSNKTPSWIFAHHLTKNQALKRINLLLKPPCIRLKKLRLAFSILAIFIALILILKGKFWIF